MQRSICRVEISASCKLLTIVAPQSYRCDRFVATHEVQTQPATHVAQLQTLECIICIAHCNHYRRAYTEAVLFVVLYLGKHHIDVTIAAVEPIVAAIGVEHHEILRSTTLAACIDRREATTTVATLSIEHPTLIYVREVVYRDTIALAPHAPTFTKFNAR